MSGVTVRYVSTECKLCAHDERYEMDRALVLKQTTQTKIAKRVGCSKMSVSRHYRNHLLPAIGDLLRRRKDAEGLDILAELQELYVDLKDRYQAILDLRDRQVIPAYHNQLRKDLELLARITGELEVAKLQIDITQTQQFIEVNQVVIAALSDFPEARLAVAAALKVDQ